MNDNAKCCEAAGGAEAKSGDNRKALSRPAGMAATSAALGNKTCSGHKGSSVNNDWKGAPTGYGDNENIKGYGG
ncbi:MAG: hypothetical protein GY906_23545 [bacterium]|nr:hypothetical protein [bacterium]